MRKKIKVHPEDYTGEQLKQLAREGKLYIDEAEKVSIDDIINNVRAYIAPLKSYVTESFSTSVDALWEDIFSCEELRDLLIPSSKTRLCRDLNKAGVKGIICVLQNNGVYKEYSSPKLDKLLERSDVESSSRRYLTQGLQKPEQIRKLREIVKKNNH